MTSTSNDCAQYHQTKTTISFSFRRKMNFGSLIQPSQILPVEFIKTHSTKES